MKKVAHVIIKFSELHWGGAEEYILNVTMELNNRGNFQCDVLTLNVFDEKKNDVIRGCKVKRFDYFYPYIGKKNKEEFARRAVGAISFSLMKELRNYDLVHLHVHNSLTTSLAFYCKLMRIPFIIHIHSPYLEEPEFRNNVLVANSDNKKLLSPLGDIVRQIIRAFFSSKKAVHNADLLLWANGIDAQIFKEKYPQKKSFWMPNGVDIKKFSFGNGEEFRRKFDLINKKIILCVGNIYYIKNQIFLLKMLKELLKYQKDIKMVLIGKVADSVYFEKMRKYIMANNLEENVLLIKGLSHDSNDLINAYAAADLFVLPSLYEAFPLVLVEALASKTLCIANNVGGIPCIIKDKFNGLIFNMSDEAIEQIAKQIYEIMKDSQQSNVLCNNGYNSVLKNFTWEQVAKQLEEKYFMICEGE